MQRKKLLLILLFVVVLFISFFGFSNKSYAVDINSFEEWVDTNYDALSYTLKDYTYIIIKNNDNIVMFYTNAPNAQFYFNGTNSGIYGYRARVSLTSDIGNHLYSAYVFNPNGDNSFVMPTNLDTEFDTSCNESNTSIINDFEKNSENFLYSSGSYLINGAETTAKKSIPLLLTPLAVIVAMAQPQGVMKEILIVLPLILVVVVSFLGLRKALRMLLTLLARS